MTTRFIFSIDVETRSRGNPAVDIFGRVPGHAETFGIELMMDILEKHQVRGTFFFNAYEVGKHDEAEIARAARLIHSRGHDLELHTHPQPMYPFYGISQASLGDQAAILEKGMSLIEGWTGKKVVAHRAGAFSANTDTLQAAASVGLLADSSLSPGSRVYVPLVHQVGVSNAPSCMSGIWEIPLTGFEQVHVGPWRSRRALDIEACSLSEIKYVTRWAVRRGLPTLCILMHSFSLSRYGRPNRRAFRRLDKLLAWLRTQNGIEISTVEQICRDAPPKPLSRPSAELPVTGVWLTWRRAVTCWNEGWKNLLVAALGAAFLTFAAVVLGSILYLGLRRPLHGQMHMRAGGVPSYCVRTRHRPC